MAGLIALLAGAWLAVALWFTIAGARRSAAARAVIDEHGRLGALIEAGPAAPLLVAPDGAISGSGRLAGALGLTELPPRWLALFGDDKPFPAEAAAPLGRVLAEAAAGGRSSLTVRPAGSARIFRVDGSPAPPGFGERSAVLWFVDVTASEEEKARLTAQLERRAERRRGLRDRRRGPGTRPLRPRPLRPRPTRHARPPVRGSGPVRPRPLADLLQRALRPDVRPAGRLPRRPPRIRPRDRGDARGRKLARGARLSGLEGSAPGVVHERAGGGGGGLAACGREAFASRRPAAARRRPADDLRGSHRADPARLGARHPASGPLGDLRQSVRSGRRVRRGRAAESLEQPLSRGVGL